MTNTRYIGGVVDLNAQRDRLSPYYAYKVAAMFLNEEKGQVELVSPHYYDTHFSLSDDSRCKKGHKDFASCSCGFYGYKDVEKAYTHWKDDSGAYSNMFIFQMAFSSSVVVAEHGYRATHQRVCRVLTPRCWNCANKGDGLILHSTSFFVPACNECAKGHDLITFDEFSLRYSPEGFKPIVIDSAQDIQKEAVPFLGGESLKLRALEAIDALLVGNNDFLVADISSLIQAKLAERATNSMNDTLNS
jgi:hypothetical protein